MAFRVDSTALLRALEGAAFQRFLPHNDSERDEHTRRAKRFSLLALAISLVIGAGIYVCTPLLDFIIGKEVKDHPEQRYVRVPNQKRIYGVNVKADLSTRFSDWIETNLLKLDASRLRKVIIDHKSFNPDNGTKVPLDVKAGDKILFGKYGGTEVKVDGAELLVMREEDVMAVIEK